MDPPNTLDASIAQDMKNYMFTDKIGELLINRFGVLSTIVLDYYEIQWKDMMAIDCAVDSSDSTEIMFRFSGIVLGSRAYICPNRLYDTSENRGGRVVIHNDKLVLVEYEGGDPKVECAYIDRIEGVAPLSDVNDSVRPMFQWGDLMHGVHSVPLVKFWHDPSAGLGDRFFVMIADAYGGTAGDRIKKMCEAVHFNDHLIGPIVGYVV